MTHDKKEITLTRSGFVLALSLFVSSACSTEETLPPENETTTVQSQIIDVLIDAPNGRISGTTSFTGDDAQIEYTIDGVTKVQPISGVASIEVSYIEGAIVLTGFSSIIDDFQFDVMLPGPTPALVVPVSVSNAVVDLATETLDGTAIDPPEVNIDLAGFASVSPSLAGQAHFKSVLAGSYDYSTIEELSEPIIAVFDVSDTEVRISIDYEYTMLVDWISQIPITSRIHYELAILRS